MHLVCRCSFPVWRRSFLKKGTPVTYFCPALDPPLGGSGRKTTTLVRDHEYFIPTKFHQNPLSSSGEEVENVNSLRTTDAGRRTDGQTDGRTDGRCAMTIAHSSLRLGWAKNVTSDVRTEQRAIIKFCVDIGKTPIDTKKMLEQSSIFSTVSPTLVYKRHTRFSDEKRAGRPLTCDENMKARIQDVILQDRRLTDREIASLCDMNRVCSRWVPWLLSDENKLRRMQSCSTFSRKFRAGGERWLDRIITMDETWRHYFDPETKQESRVWKHRGSPAQKKARVSKSMGKHMFIFLPTGVTTPIEIRPPVIFLRRKVTGVHFLRPEGSFYVCRKRVITPPPQSRHNQAEKSDPL